MFVLELVCNRSITRGILCAQRLSLSFVTGAVIQGTCRISQNLHVTHMRYEQPGVCERSIRKNTLLGGQSAFMCVSQLPLQGFSRCSKRELCIYLKVKS